MIVELAGIDGAGKTTVASLLAERLPFEVRKVAPFDSAFWRRAPVVEDALGIRALEYCKGAAILQALISTAAGPFPDRVVFDRYIEGALMYWHVKALPLPPPELLSLLPKSDLVVLLDIDPAVGLERRARPSERTREEELEYLEASARYLRGRADEHGWLVIDGTRPLEGILTDLEVLLG